MTADSRTFIFPGGMLQVVAYDDDSDDDPGVYLELYNYTDAANREHEDGDDIATETG
ncbi:hypothetical protein IU500_05080 [Nocardia terpenica]|uniref:hypothetical protein n=1 Tax=Nocardia terpenica TaxID=455432 RepID=UPI0018934314|nr:hypothetical protein [Nocardia terpenica]MBF6060156.1 hypothetical protein [Nocardia terpenica]MBF6103416.1 hypothetical protein [Nocardia terpenica]MBF6112210.1 hypothetical protein [Nocardia terpenica]MBF6117637.1 hypothetical protein [Nocardia terpenica]MBF6153619.1 hypothetical protein [Nocardia terpenica]